MKKSIIKIDIPKDTAVTIGIDNQVIEFSKKTRNKKSIVLKAGEHVLYVKEINLLEYSNTWLLNIFFIILDIFTSIKNQGEKPKLVKINRLIKITETGAVSICLHYGNCDRIIISTDDPEKNCIVSSSDYTKGTAVTAKLEKRWIITNIIAISIIFLIVILLCILITISSFKPNTEALPIAKLFFPMLIAAFVAMAIHLILHRIRYKQ